MKLIRRLLAILLFILLGLGVYLSLKAFSGVDPFSFDSDKLLGLFGRKSKAVIEEAGIRGLPIASNTINDPNSKKQVLLAIGLVADSHTDSKHLQKALEQAKQAKVNYVLALGDYTAVGTIKELTDAKKVFDQSRLQYYIIPGDHDLWANKSKAETGTKNYEGIFGRPYQVVTEQGITQIMVNNANFDAGLSAEQMQWLEVTLVTAQENRVDKPVFVFLHQPIYHPTSSHVMGRLNADVEAQRVKLLEMFQKYGVSEVISGDLHFFSRYTDSTTGLKMTTLGAVTNERNIQKPRFAILKIYIDNSYDIEDIEIK